MTREEATTVMPHEMAKAFEKGRQAAIRGIPELSNPYGGVPWEAETIGYPAMVPKRFIEFIGWLRAEWYWGYEDVVPPEPECPDCGGTTVCQLANGAIVPCACHEGVPS